MVTPKVEKSDVVNPTKDDIAALFYILVMQNQLVNPGSELVFDLRQLTRLPKKPKLFFQKNGNSLSVEIPEKPSDRKKRKTKQPSLLYLPNDGIIKP